MGDSDPMGKVYRCCECESAQTDGEDRDCGGSSLEAFFLPLGIEGADMFLCIGPHALLDVQPLMRT